MLDRKPDLEWSAKLPATADYQERVEEMPAPNGLKPGFYFVLSSSNPQFGVQGNQIGYSGVWVSNLAIVMRTQWGNSRVEGFVLDALSGEPIADADVQAWYSSN